MYREVDAYLEDLRLATSSSDLKKAEAIYSDAKTAYPDSIAFHVLWGRLVRRSAGVDAALHFWVGIRGDFPNHPQPDVELFELALSQENLEQARQYLDSAEKKRVNKQTLVLMKASLAEKSGDPAGASELLQLFIQESETPSAPVMLRLAETQLQLKQFDAATEGLQRVLQVDPGNDTARALLLSLAQTEGDAAGALAECLALIEKHPSKASWYVRAQHLYIESGQPAKAQEILRLGVSRDVKGLELFSEITKLQVSRDLAELAVERAKAIGQEASLSERKLADEILLTFSDISMGEAQLLQLREKPLEEMTALDWLAFSPVDGKLQRPVAFELLSPEIEIAASRTTSCMAFVFLGLRNKAMMPLKVFDRFLAALGCSAVYLRDDSRMLGNLGFASVAPGFDASVEYMKSLMAKHGATRSVTMGFSAGGYPAIRYGLALGAEKVINFSGPSNIRADFMQEDGRGKIVVRKLQTLPEDVKDLKPLVIRANGSSEIHLVYGELNPQDSRHACYLESCPGVFLHPISGYDEHATALHMVYEQKMEPFLRELIEAER